MQTANKNEFSIEWFTYACNNLITKIIDRENESTMLGVVWTIYNIITNTPGGWSLLLDLLFLGQLFVSYRKKEMLPLHFGQLANTRNVFLLVASIFVVGVVTSLVIVEIDLFRRWFDKQQISMKHSHCFIYYGS